MKTDIYTIGYAGFSLPDFINELKARRITALIDVRSAPFSRTFPDFNKETAAKALQENKIIYRSYAGEFGARRSEREFYTDGKVDFIKVSTSEIFKSGIDKICAGIELGYVFALMCAERDPLFCHRAVLVARAFVERGFTVSHIVRNSADISQTEFERQLTESCFPKSGQVSCLWQNLTSEQKLSAAYERRGREIAVARVF
jgi:uncharacterized protein (DUF488 family)